MSVANELQEQTEAARAEKAGVLAEEISNDFLGDQMSDEEVLKGYVTYPRYQPGMIPFGYFDDTPVDHIARLLREDPKLAGFTVEVIDGTPRWIHIGWFS